MIVDEARSLLEIWGEDISPVEYDWCWEDFAKQYPHIRHRAETYFEAKLDGAAAFKMVQFFGSSQAWAEKVIEASDDCTAAQLMIKHCGSDPAWAERIGRRPADGQIACKESEGAPAQATQGGETQGRET
jgi:hypothetical protein